MRAECLRRSLAQAVHRAAVPHNTDAIKPCGLVYVVAELERGDDRQEWLSRFIERRLLLHIGLATKVWFASYGAAADAWLTYRLLPYVAFSITTAAGYQSAEGIKWECYMDSRGRRCFIVLGP